MLMHDSTDYEPFGSQHITPVAIAPGTRHSQEELQYQPDQ